MHITIFKTSVETPGQVSRLYSALTTLPLIKQWNFDLEDCDRILRVITTELQPQAICQVLQTEGFSCEPLESFVYVF